MGPVAEGLTLALPKGRILEHAIPLLVRAGFDLAGTLGGKDDRRLQFELPGGHRVLLVKPVDVPTYVEHGIADLGVAGKDTLEEEARDLFEPVDLGIGRCRMVVAELADGPTLASRGAPMRVATKYPRIAFRHYQRKGIQPEIIALYGSVELGPLTGLSHQIVDLVESGETLRQNHLVEIETVLEVSSRLIVHPASLRLRHAAVTKAIADLRTAVREHA